MARRIGERREPLRRTFDSAADLYDSARPGYPDELFDDLVEMAGLERGARLLEIGCATGKATRPWLERGFSVVCVELGAQLAEKARQNLAAFPVEIHVAPFESWEPEHDAFDLVYAATAWHWLDPAIRDRKAHGLLRAGGHLAFWSAGHAFPVGFDPFFTETYAPGSATAPSSGSGATGMRSSMSRAARFELHTESDSAAGYDGKRTLMLSR
jgi:SAM-dependent methyltransferase